MKDRTEDAGRTTRGDVEETLGKLAANDRHAPQGVVGQALGTAQDGYGRARERVRRMLDNAPAAARDAVATGRDLYHRGADAVTRSATDNSALTLFAAGVAVAAISWLILGPRKDRDEA